MAPKANKDQLEAHRSKWIDIAQEHGWYHIPFYVQVWVDKQGNIVDSVTYRGLDRDVILPDEEVS